MPASSINKKKSNNDVSKVLASGGGKIKKKIRDIQRLLKRTNLPATVRVNNERTLKALEHQLNNVVNKSKEKKVAKKYHMVRFFEKKKATRLLKQAKKAFDEAEATNERKTIKKARTYLKHKQIDLAYTMLFPKDQKYISLYPNPKDEDNSTLTSKAKEGMKRTEQAKLEFRKHVESLIQDNKLPFSLDDIVTGKKVSVEKTSSKKDTEEIDAPSKKKTKETDDFFDDEAEEDDEEDEEDEEEEDSSESSDSSEESE